METATLVMSHRERALSALNLEEADRVPLWEYSINGTAVEKILGERMPKTKGIYGAPSMPGHSRQEALEEDARMRVRCHVKLGLDMTPVNFIFNCPPTGWEPTYLDENTYIDECGVTYRYVPETDQAFATRCPIERPEDVEKYTYPDPHASGRLDYFRIMVREAAKQNMAAVAEVGGPFEYVCGSPCLVQLSNYVTFMYKHPNFADRLADMVTNFSLEIGKMCIEEGADVISISDDIAYKKGPMISPGLYRKFIAPRIRKMVQIFKGKGACVILHTDGNTLPILDDIVKTGLDGLHSIEPAAGMDIGYVKEKYGDQICLLGNVDVSQTLPFGSVEDVATEVKSCINVAAPGGGYFLTSSNSIYKIIPAENVMAMFKTGRKYGVYPMRGL